MKNTTISVSENEKARFDAYFHKRRYEAISQEGKKKYRASDALVEIMDKAGVPQLQVKAPEEEPKEEPSQSEATE